MTRQENFRKAQKEELFSEFMESNLFEGWEDALNPDQVLWYWDHFEHLEYLPF